VAILGENTGIEVKKGILEEDDLSRTTEPAVYPINENTNTTNIYSWIRFELSINKRRYAYIAYRVGNGYDSNIPGYIEGSIDKLLVKREAEISKKLDENSTLSDAQLLIKEYQSKIFTSVIHQNFVWLMFVFWGKMFDNFNFYCANSSCLNFAELRCVTSINNI
jgi:hypothetical protein